jgi:hypothetical protein
MARKLMILSAAVVAVAASAIVAEAAFSAGPVMGPAAKITHPAFHGYYDGHKVTYLNTDVSSRTEAKVMRINYSAPSAG